METPMDRLGFGFSLVPTTDATRHRELVDIAEGAGAEGSDLPTSSGWRFRAPPRAGDNQAAE